ncbi:MAG: hypothetical protein K940chlam8_00269 [Chlamydiae bacterium]|nr:hypothetical protein [Chlamydiota bacterium]
MYNHLIKTGFLELEEEGETLVFFIDQQNQLQFVGSFCEELEYTSSSVKSFFESLTFNRDLHALNLTIDFNEETNLHFINGTFQIPASSCEFMGLLSLIKDQVLNLKHKFHDALETDLLPIKRFNH